MSLMLEMVMKQLNIDPVEFKKKFEEAYAAIHAFDVRQKHIECKIDLLLTNHGFDVNQINLDLLRASPQYQGSVIPPTTNEIGNA